MRSIFGAGTVRGPISLLLALAVAGAAMAQQPAKPRPRAGRIANLSRAAAAGDLKQIQFLVDSGKDPNTATRGSQLPLFEAIKGNHIEAVKLLVELGAKLGAYDFEYELAPIQVAATLGRTEICAYLVSAGVPVKEGIRRRLAAQRGDPPLLLAAEHNHFDTVRYFLDAGADPLVRASRGEDLLYYAVRLDNAEYIELAFSLGADMRTVPARSSTPLHLAAKTGRMALVERLLREPLHIDAVDADGATPLHRACEEGATPVVRRLVERGANVNALTVGKKTPLALAVENSRTDLVTYLLVRGSDPAIVDDGGLNSLHHALVQKNETVATALIDHANALGEALDPKGRSPMQIATDLGLQEVVHRLIAAGASLHIQGQELGWTPLFEAVLEPGDELVRILLDKGADARARSHASFLPLHLACLAGNAEAAARLIEAGSNPNDQDNLARWSPMHHAAANGSPELVDLLVKYAVDVNARDTRGSTPLHVAADLGNADAMQRLMAQGAGVDAVDALQRTPLHRAVISGHVPVVQRLLAGSASRESRDTKGDTPLDTAYSVGNDEIVALLEKSGADVDRIAPPGETAAHRAVAEGNIGALKNIARELVDARDLEGRTPLHLAVEGGNLETVELLVKTLGADTGLRDDAGMSPLDLAADAGRAEIANFLAVASAPDGIPGHPAGWTPLHFAAAGGNLDTVRVLIEHGMQVNAADVRHWTPLHAAVDNGHTEVAAELLQHGAHISPDASGMTPLGLARAAKRDALVTLLAPAS